MFIRQELLKPLRFLTYNVHGCVGSDRRLDPARIVEVIARLQPDVVALQELDVGRGRSGAIDQAGVIGAGLQMEHVFHPAMHMAGEKYGDAILSRLPMKTVKVGGLPSHGEPRGAIWCEIEHDGRMLNVVNTHLGVTRRERLKQLDTLLGQDWLDHPACRERDLVLMGDFNSVPSSPAFARLGSKLTVAHPPELRFAAPTFPARMPLLRLDHIFHTSNLRTLSVEVDRSRLARAASDHLPLLATLEA